MKYVKRKKKIL